MRPESMEGQVLGHYRLLRPLGYGGTSTVFLAEDIHLKRAVAVKVFEPRVGDEKDFLRRFSREARVLAQLDHPHILSIYTYGEYEKSAYLVTPFMSGGSLRDCLHKNPVYTEEDALPIIIRVLDALQYAHNQGLIHRDIKPGNLLFKADNTPLLADFGLVKILPTATNVSLEDSGSMSTSLIAGTPDYMAPEQISGKPEPASDIYATAAMLHEMLTGQRLFDAESSLSVLMKHMHEAPTPVRDLKPELSEEVEALILRALAKNPRERFASAADFRDALMLTPHYKVSSKELVSAKVTPILPLNDEDDNHYQTIDDTDKTNDTHDINDTNNAQTPEITTDPAQTEIEDTKSTETEDTAIIEDIANEDTHVQLEQQSTAETSINEHTYATLPTDQTNEEDKDKQQEEDELATKSVVVPLAIEEQSTQIVTDKEQSEETPTHTFSTTPAITEIQELTSEQSEQSEEKAEDLPAQLESALSKRVLARTASMPASPSLTPAPAISSTHLPTYPYPQTTQRNAFIPVLITICLVIIITTAALFGAVYMYPEGLSDILGAKPSPTATVPIKTPTATTPGVTPTATKGVTPTVEPTANVVPPVQLSCPTIGTSQAAKMPTIPLGKANSIVYIENNQDTQTAYLKQRTIVSNTQVKTIAKITDAQILDAQISEDGQWILFTVRVDKQDQLRLISVLGTNQQILFCAGGAKQSIASAQWSFDKQYIIFNFQSTVGSPYTTKLLDLTRNKLETVIDPQASQVFQPIMWLDNSRVLLTTIIPNTDAPAKNLYLLDLAAGLKKTEKDLVLVQEDTLKCKSFDTALGDTTLYMSSCTSVVDPNAGAGTIAGAPSSLSIRSSETKQDPFESYTFDKLAISELRTLDEDTVLLLGSQADTPAKVELFSLDTNGKNLKRIASPTIVNAAFNEFSHNLWATISKDNTLVALNATSGDNLSVLYTINIKDGQLNPFARTASDNTTLHIVGWTNL